MGEGGYFVFEQGFATLFRAVERIRGQLETADSDLRQHLTEELVCIQKLGERYIDYWMTLDEHIAELLETYADIPSEERGNLNAGDSTSLHTPALTTSINHVKSRTCEDLALLNDDDDADWMDAAFDLSDPLTCAFRKGLAYYDLFMFEDAAKSLEQVVEATGSAIGRLYLAGSYAANQHVDEALEQLLQLRKETREPLYLAAADELEALLQLQRNNPERAIECLQRVARRIPRYADVWFNLGVSYLFTHNHHAAIVALRNAVQLDPQDIEIWRVMGYAELQGGSLADAEAACRNGLNVQPLNLELLYLLALIQRASRDYDACIRTCRKMVQVDAGNARAWSLLAWVYARTDRLEQATATLKMRLSIQPDDAEALLQLGIVQVLTGDANAAERVLLKCFPSSSHKSLLWMALGRVSAMMGRHHQAHTRYLRAMKEPRKPIRRLAMYSYAQLLMEQGQYQDAETYLKGAALIGQPNAAIYEALAECAREQGRSHEAEKLNLQASACHEPASDIE